MIATQWVRAIGLLVCFTMTAAIAAASPGWRLLGSRTVTDSSDHDTIGVTAARGGMRRLKITVRDAGVDFHRVVVHYRNGADEVLEIRDSIPAGGETRAIDLRGGERVITSVDFWYDARTIHGRKAVVSLYGAG